MRQPDPGSLDRTIWYLPHHASNRDDKRTTESIIAFNASAKGKSSVSLNDCVFPGPAQQPNLAPVLIRFRAHRVILLLDVEKMFLEVTLVTKDRLEWFRSYLSGRV